MADLSTPALIKTEYLATSRYDVDDDLDLAKRHVAVLRALLLQPQTSARESDSLGFNQDMILEMLDAAKAFVAAKAPQSEANRLANPSVVHADFSQTGKYYGGTFT